MEGLNILLVEDSQDDADLILLQLAEAGMDVTGCRVATEEATRSALAEEKWDAVIADFNLPRFGAASALAVIQEMGIDLPFIVVSGFIGEEAAVGILKAGAHDFVAKSHLARLGPAIEREMREAAARREHRRAARELVESRRQLRELSSHLQSVREDERAHIARELHDQLGQMLTALKMDVAWVRGRSASAGEVVLDKLGDMATLIDQTIDSVRRISSDLRPVMLDDLGLRAALEWLVGDFRKRNEDVCCEILLALDDRPLEGRLATAVFRLVQECLTNVSRHAQASEVNVFAGSRDDGILVVVADNGRGLPEEPPRHGGYGLLGMRERVEVLGGTFTINSIPGGGVTVEATLPLPAEGSAP
ncbi:MAG: domain S-box protein [Rhodocyclaceae bacterium]|nr:domain S-box protein [Rhodocyclaceae bacterium]